MFAFLRPYIFTLDPEAAHDLAIKSLKLNLAPNILINLIDIITWKCKRFVVIGNDFDPNRRDITR